MSAAAFVSLLVVALVLCAVWPSAVSEVPDRSPLGHRWLYGLVDVDYDEELVLVTPRGVELPYCPSWDLDDVLGTLADVETLG